MKEQTAVQFLQQALSIHFTFEQQMKFEGLFQQAKEMEKEQIFDAHENGHNYYDVNGISKEQYFKETFEKTL